MKEYSKGGGRKLLPRLQEIVRYGPEDEFAAFVQVVRSRVHLYALLAVPKIVLHCFELWAPACLCWLAVAAIGLVKTLSKTLSQPQSVLVLYGQDAATSLAYYCVHFFLLLSVFPIRLSKIKTASTINIRLVQFCLCSCHTAVPPSLYSRSIAAMY
jgi:hypothetical protein